MKPKQMYCVLVSYGTGNTEANHDNIIFSIKE